MGVRSQGLPRSQAEQTEMLGDRRPGEPRLEPVLGSLGNRRAGKLAAIPHEGERIRDELARLGERDLGGLRALWQSHWGDTPPLRSVPLLRLLIGWRLQAALHGGLDRDTRRALARTGRTEPEGLHLGVGARLTRLWQGREVEVTVAADGFVWEGRRYRSLSAAASAIAGSRWNGPRFFGLRDAGSDAVGWSTDAGKSAAARDHRR